MYALRQQVCMCVSLSVRRSGAGLVLDLEEEASVRAERWIPPEGSDK